jgi:hypothetical protein
MQTVGICHTATTLALFCMIIAFSDCATQRAVTSMRHNRIAAVPHTTRIADRRSAAKAVVLSPAHEAQMALNTLILAVSIVLLLGAVWMHAT